MGRIAATTSLIFPSRLELGLCLFTGLTSSPRSWRRCGPHTIATGITPSGPVHIGNMREVMTAEAVYRALLDRGVEAQLIYIADTFDRLRRLYPFLPESFNEHIGKPLSEIPCPTGCCGSYADHFLKSVLEEHGAPGHQARDFPSRCALQRRQVHEAIKTAFRAEMKSLAS